MSQVPVIRPEAVERGRRAAADPHYPSDTIIEKIALLLADEMLSALRLN